MLSNKYYIFDKIIQKLFKNDLPRKSHIRRSFIFFCKINFVILFFAIIFFNFISILSRLIFFKNFKNIPNNNQSQIINISCVILFPLKNKVFELLYSLQLIQNRYPDEKVKEKKNSNINVLNNKNIFDVIVIGSGPGGSISSYYLNKKFKSKVLLLEQGGHYQNFKKKHPANEFLRMWKNGGVNMTMFGKMISYATGSCLGGGSEINSGLYHSPDKNFIERWKFDCEVDAIDETDLNNKFNELKKICNVELNYNKTNIPNYSHFIKGAEINKFKIEELSSFHSFKAKNEIKKNSMSTTFIKKFIEEGGKYCCYVKAKKILKKEQYWEIVCNYKNKKSRLKAKRVFLCAGSIYTAHLLNKSKIKLKNKISNFKFHPMLKIVAEFDNKVQNGDENVHPFQITEFYPDFIIGNASSGKEFMDINFYNTNLNPNKSNWENKLIYHVTYSFGEGNVFSIFDNPLVDYRIDEKNIKIIRKSLQIASKVLFDGGAKKLTVLNNEPIDLLKNNYENIIKSINMKNLKFSSVHILGGLKSGANKKCHLDSFGRVYNHDNLYVNDSSIINHKLLKNPQGTIMSLAKRNIDNFLEKIT